MVGFSEEAVLALFMVGLSFLAGVISLLLIFFGQTIYPMVPWEMLPQLRNLLSIRVVKLFFTSSISTLLVLLILVLHAKYTS